ncbi:M20/M25/M40 family metallo-hydrolase [Lacisediminihabitans changchengi]|uniref:M20/M25/M40 family metallo-hydrolase n=1 Tax=Lacisediminihabitans changchengi TaxID=2787634 RepID=A0A934W4J2_9MICO|nr:M20/M25/M40 family metallo-hydrolase [Lacisediminihabitans changchengi]MBK4347550.1 M20/M25/M40 family metallo-hydrolase [Lacisediminihabitans changchengi]
MPADTPHLPLLPLEHLRELVRLPTMSRTEVEETDWAPFDAFIDALPRLYPALHAALEREIVGGHSLLYRWTGSGDGSPTVLMAHYDVVPATEEGWEHPPFAAELSGDGDEQLVWGRGTLDDKGSLVAALEGVEAAVLAGLTPRADLYLSFGHDEETVGTGAQAIVDLLASRGIRPELVLDEGGAVVEGIFPGVSEPIAVVGVSEKGIVTLSLRVDQDGGHASTPPKLSATARLARAIVRLNRRPFPSGFTATNVEMIETLGAHATGPLRWAFGNLWLTKPLLLRVFARLSDETAAMVRTTQAVTQLSGSQAANALAERAVATVNIRVAAGSSVAEAVEHVRRAIRDPRVAIEVPQANEPSPVSPTSGSAWELLRSTIVEIYPGTIVTPYVMLAASDSRHFTRISDHVYRFSPFRMSTQERGTLHAMNERMHVATFLRGVEFYTRLVRSLATER